MSYQYQQPGQPVVGATFVPGGVDDYYIPENAPELISPAPQRIMPEVPENIQEGIEHLELEAEVPRNSMAQPSTHNQQNQPYHSSGFAPRSSSLIQPAKAVSEGQPRLSTYGYAQPARPADLPSFSPFPKLVNPPANVPPTDDEKEAILEDARVHVLNSNDPEMQLAWAQDALAYVDIAIAHEQRISESQPARSVTPQVEHQLRVDAMSIVSFLADQHHPKAEFMRGMWLEFGKFGLRQDKKEAFRCYSRAADKGYARAEYRIGMQYEQSNDPGKALAHYKRGAEAGDSPSNYRIGMMTLLGQHGQQQDYARGVQLISQAALTADENAPQGAYVYGMLLARELPQIQVPEIYLEYDEKGARLNIEKAAYLGFAKAQLKMGSAYELCTLGCDFSPALSLHYNALAARQGEAEAEMAISKWFLCGFDGVFQKNEELAYVYAQRAAQSGLATALFALGYFNEIGVHVPVNIEKALEWYQKASKAGNQDAVGRIESISKSRTLSKQDHENVAITRIKSQYGSKRGGRPERFKNSAASTLPSIADEPADSPGYQEAPYMRHVNAQQGRVVSPTHERIPSRTATTTPYPLDDKPPQFNAYSARPASVAPYPLEDGPPGQGRQRPGLAADFISPEIRSASAAPQRMQQSSAFNLRIDDDMRSQAAAGRRPGQGSNQLPLRPYSSIDDIGPGRRPQMGGRAVSGPGPGPYRQPGGPGAEHPESNMPPPGANQQPTKLDIGYSAPQEERRNKLQKPGTPSGGRQRQPQMNDIGYVAPLNPRPSKSTGNSPASSPRMQGAAVQSTHDRPATTRPAAEGRSSVRPGRQDSMPTTAMSGALPSSNRPLHQAETAPAAKPASQPAARPARQPGQGPKTFEEMGVPQAKQDGDCIVM